jgi:hypothetical protein
MDTLAGLLLIIGMYFVVPIVVCIGTIALLGGSERLLPGPMRDRASARRQQNAEHH